MTPPCACQDHCGDIDESHDHPRAICKGLPVGPQTRLVEIVLVPRRLAFDEGER